jgi:hypothetical protein
VAAYGADPTALDALAQLMAKAAASIDQIGSQLGARTHHAPWRSPQADHFRQQWNGVYYPALRAARDELTNASNQLATNARDQRAASDPSGGVTPNTPTALLALATEYGLSTTAANAYTILRFAQDYGARLANLDTLSHIMATAGPPTGFLDKSFAIFGLVGVGVDGYGLVQAMANGSTSQELLKGTGVVIDGAGIVFPPVAVADAGWNIGWQAGLLLNRETHISDHWANFALSGAPQENGQMTPAQANALATRYDGVSGFGHFMEDTGTSLSRKLERWL